MKNNCIYRPFLLFFFVFYAKYCSQSISGILYNSDTPTANIKITVRENNTLTFIGNSITNYEGYYSIIVPKEGDYIIHININGKEVYNEKVTIQTNLKKNIYINHYKDIEEIKIQGGKKIIEKKIDRLIFNVHNSKALIGEDAYEALRFAPRVFVNNESIKILGKDATKLMIDGRLINIANGDIFSFLKSLKTEDIKSIEIITNPPSRYSAEGNSGIINIVTQKNIKDSWKLSYVSSGQVSKTFSSKNGLLFSINKNKFSHNFGLNQNYGFTSPINTGSILYPEETWEEKTHKLSKSDGVNVRSSFNYKISPKFSSGIQYVGMFSNPIISSYMGTNILKSKLSNSYIQTISEEYNKNSFHSLNYHILYRIDSIGKSINIDFDWFNSKNANNQKFKTIKNLNIKSGNNLGNQNINNFSLNVDVDHPTKWIMLNYGGRLSTTSTKNEIKYFDIIDNINIINDNLSNVFDFKETTSSIFFAASKKLFKDNLEIQTGIRLENTKTKGISNDQISGFNHTNIFPSFYALYNLGRDKLTLNYSKRINRPSFNLLNPFKWTYSPYSFLQGNPYLLPEYSHNLEVGYNHKDFLFTSIVYSHLNDGFDYLSYIDKEKKQQQVTSTNFIRTRTIGLNNTFNFNPTKWLSTSSDFIVNYTNSVSDSKITIKNIKGLSFEAKTNITLNLNHQKTLFFVLNGWYTSNGFSGLDTSSSAYQIDTALKILLMKKNLQMSLYFNDIFRSNKIQYVGFSNNIETRHTNYNDLQFIRLSILYIFGNKLIKIKENEQKNKEEKERASL